MAEPFLTDLRRIGEQWRAADQRVGDLEYRHFFSGAAAYRDGAIAATLTPVGLAFKVPAAVREDLLGRGVAEPLRYFPSGPVKKDYVLFEPSEVDAAAAARLLLGDRP